MDVQDVHIGGRIVIIATQTGSHNPTIRCPGSPCREENGLTGLPSCHIQIHAGLRITIILLFIRIYLEHSFRVVTGSGKAEPKVARRYTPVGRVRVEDGLLVSVVIEYVSFDIMSVFDSKILHCPISRQLFSSP